MAGIRVACVLIGASAVVLGSGCVYGWALPDVASLPGPDDETLTPHPDGNPPDRVTSADGRVIETRLETESAQTLVDLSDAVEHGRARVERADYDPSGTAVRFVIPEDYTLRRLVYYNEWTESEPYGFTGGIIVHTYSQNLSFPLCPVPGLGSTTCNLHIVPGSWDLGIFDSDNMLKEQFTLVVDSRPALVEVDEPWAWLGGLSWGAAITGLTAVLAGAIAAGIVGFTDKSTGPFAGILVGGGALLGLGVAGIVIFDFGDLDVTPLQEAARQ